MREIRRPGGPGRRIRTWVRGAIVDRAEGGRFLSDPSDADLERWVGGGALRCEASGRSLPRVAAPEPFDGISGYGSSLPAGTEALILGVAFTQQVWIARRDGEPLTDHREGCRLRVTATVRGQAGTGTATLDVVRKPGRTPDLAKVVHEASRRAQARCSAAAAPAGPTAAVFAPGVGGVVVHELVGHALEGDATSSLLAGSRRRFDSSSVQVMDDPRRSRAAWTIDDEGTPSGPAPLIRDGRVVGGLHDLRSAAGSRAAPTGHGRRSSFLDPVRPRMGCTFLGNGPDRADDVLRDTSDGVYVRRLETARVDSCAGLATFRVTDADRIRRGRLDTPLEPFLLTVTLDDTLSTLDAVADDLAFDTCVGSCLKDGQPLTTSVGAPTFRIGVVRVHTSRSSS